jgi:KaiC/GvpD/RAD55 family RecA-like ATPase
VNKRNYILGDAHAEPIVSTYAEACTEMLTQVPSVRFKDFAMTAEITKGLRPREFTICCGATGTGKTTLMANWSMDLLRQRVPHFVASVETGRTDFVKRVISAMVKEDWNTGDEIPIDKVTRFHANHAHLFDGTDLHLSLYENRFSVEQLMSDIAWHVDKYGVKVAIIDNLNFFLEVTRASDQMIEMDRVIHELIIFCKQVDVHVIMIMHPKKTDTGRVDSEFDIKGSSTAVQEAHNVILFNRIDQKHVDAGVAEPGDREITIKKMRRRGIAVGKKIILGHHQGVAYFERRVI